MMYRCVVTDFDDWRHKARQFIQAKITPHAIHWQSENMHHPSLFATDDAPALPPLPSSETLTRITVPPDFIALAKTVSCHRDEEKWSLLYECLWRLSGASGKQEKNLLRISSDKLIRRLDLLAKAVKRDAHKAKAFIRFQEYHHADGSHHYMAWHDPDHMILPLIAGFFQRRFHVMQWTIMTPDCTAYWDGAKLQFMAGVPLYEHPQEDEMQALWLEYYQSTFNPARIKLKMMRQEMPQRYWKTMPETAMIPDMLQKAEARVEEMLAFMPQDR